MLGIRSHSTLAKFGIAALLACSAFATVALADFDLSWQTIDGGGGFGTGGPYVLHGSAGQPDAGYLSGGSFSLVGGFWAVVAASPAPQCPGDIDRDGSVDLGDLSTLLSQFGSSGPGLSGDLDRDGDVDLGDLATLLSHFGVICT